MNNNFEDKLLAIDKELLALQTLAPVSSAVVAMKAVPITVPVTITGDGGSFIYGERKVGVISEGDDKLLAQALLNFSNRQQVVGLSSGSASVIPYTGTGSYDTVFGIYVRVAAEAAASGTVVNVPVVIEASADFNVELL